MKSILSDPPNIYIIHVAGGNPKFILQCKSYQGHFMYLQNQKVINDIQNFTTFLPLSCTVGTAHANDELVLVLTSPLDGLEGFSGLLNMPLPK